MSGSGRVVRVHRSWVMPGRVGVAACVAVASVVGVGLASGRRVTALDELSIVGPAGSACFGRDVDLLPNGNLVITDPCWNNSVGAVRLYDGSTRAVISTLTGSIAGDMVGSSVTVLANGNFVVSSSNWRNGTVDGAGAVTWGDQRVGVSGVVSPSNSMVGTSPSDYVGADPVIALTNGNYVVPVRGWDSPTVADVGAARWGSGTGATVGPFNKANSLVGSHPADLVGRPSPYQPSVVALTNGSYVVGSSWWDNGAATDAGAVTWANGATGIVGEVSAANSLVGTSRGDRIGLNDDDLAGVIALTNGNFVVRSPQWDSPAATDAGAATWGNGTSGLKGPVTTANSLTGSAAGTKVALGGPGTAGIVALTNGNYVVSSPGTPGFSAIGAVTWGNGATGTRGVVGIANSLVGTTSGDQVGLAGVTPLRNGNYVIASPFWSHNAGAVTFAAGSGPTAKAVSPSNSLVGSGGADRVGSAGVRALANGNYVVGSPDWSNGPTSRVGAATWGNGSTGTPTGAVSATNSLIGSTANDAVGGNGTVPLANGNYVVADGGWDNGTVPDVGAVTWGNGTHGTVGKVTAANSLVGTQEGDQVGAFGGGVGAVALADGNYVVTTANWHDSHIDHVGAFTWVDGTRPTAARVGRTNSFIGDAQRVVSLAIALPDGTAVVVTSQINANQYLLTPVRGNGPTTGGPTPTNSLQAIGQPVNRIQYDPVHHRLLILQEEANQVLLLPLESHPANTPPSVAVGPGGTCSSNGRSATTNLTISDPDGDVVAASIASSNTSLLPLSKIKITGTGNARRLTVAPVAGRSGTATVTVTANDESSMAQTSIVVVVGTNAPNTLDGTTGTDIVFGLDGTDNLRGLAGNDVLCGGNGTDTLTGGDGADFFSGGAGQDRVTDLTVNQGDTYDNSTP